jgi:hypothetical protein
MPSTYTPNLGLEQPATGEQAGVWGNTANNSYTFLDTATDGNLTIQLAAPSYALVTNQGAVSEGRNKVIIFTGALTQDATISILPNTAEKLYFVQNNTTGGFSLIFEQGSGAQFTLQNGRSGIIYATGTGTSSSVIGVIANLQVDNLLVTTALVIAGTTTFQNPVFFQGPVTFQATASILSTGAAVFQSMTYQLGGDAAYDMYYRSLAGPLTRLPIGTPAQVLQAGPAGPQWATVSMAIGGTVTGSAANCMLFINPSGQLSQDANFRYVPGVGLSIGFPTASVALHVGGALTAEFWLDNPVTSTPHRMLLAINGVARAGLGLDGAAETGGNAGSNMMLAGFSDAGSAVIYFVSGFRNTAHTTIGNYGDLGGKCNVWTTANETALVVRGGGGNLQVWQDPSGNQLGYIDSTGRAFFAGSQGYLTLTENRLDLWGTVPGNPLGTIHIGPEPYAGGTTLLSTLCIQTSAGVLDSIPPGCMRIFLRNNYFVIQFYYNGTQYYAMLSLVGQNSPNVPWQITSSGPGFQ